MNTFKCWYLYKTLFLNNFFPQNNKTIRNLPRKEIRSTPASDRCDSKIQYLYVCVTKWAWVCRRLGWSADFKVCSTDQHMFRHCNRPGSEQWLCSDVLKLGVFSVFCMKNALEVLKCFYTMAVFFLLKLRLFMKTLKMFWLLFRCSKRKGCK